VNLLDLPPSIDQLCGRLVYGASLPDSPFTAASLLPNKVMQIEADGELHGEDEEVHFEGRILGHINLSFDMGCQQNRSVPYPSDPEEHTEYTQRQQTLGRCLCIY
jgi:hypothetical protein